VKEISVIIIVFGIKNTNVSVQIRQRSNTSGREYYKNMLKARQLYICPRSEIVVVTGDSTVSDQTLG
jgi:hypothetical protein